MADTALTATAHVPNTSTALVVSAGTAIDATGTLTITPGGPIKKMLIIVVNTTASQKVATITAGVNPPAANAGADLTITLAAGDSLPTISIVQLSSSKYAQVNGKIKMTFASGMTGFVKAIQLGKKS